MIERITDNGRLLALIVRSNFEGEGASFLTGNESPLQLGVLSHKKGAQITPHIHLPVSRTISEIYEVLFLVEGRLLVEFYDPEGFKIRDSILERGDTILLASGAHGFRMLEDTKMIEVKQGPYDGIEADKRRLEVKG